MNTLLNDVDTCNYVVGTLAKRFASEWTEKKEQDIRKEVIQCLGLKVPSLRLVDSSKMCASVCDFKATVKQDADIIRLHYVACGFLIAHGVDPEGIADDNYTSALSEVSRFLVPSL